MSTRDKDDAEVIAKHDRLHDLLEASKQPDQWAAKLTEVIEVLIGDNLNDHQIWNYCRAYIPSAAGASSEDYSAWKALINTARKRLKISDPAHGWGIFGVNVRAAPYAWTEPGDIRPRERLHGNHLFRGHVSATVGAGGLGKSSLVATEALEMVSGVSLLGGIAPDQLRVWYINLEDPHDEIARHVQATAQHFDLTSDDIGDRLFVTSGRDQPLVIAEIEDRQAVICNSVVEILIEELKDKAIDVLVIDPFVSCHKLPENDNNAIDMVVKEWGRIADRAECAVHLIHHVRKGEQEVTVESARGGGAFGDGCRSVRTVNRMTEADAKKCGVDNRRLFFRVIVDKGNLSPPAEKSDWCKLVSVDLGNGVFGSPGDSIGVVTRWQWPDWLDGVTGDDFNKAAASIRAGRWRANSQSDDWVGVAVAKALALSLAMKQDRAKVVGLIKLWKASGALVEVTRQDEHRKDRKFVEVAEDADDAE